MPTRNGDATWRGDLPSGSGSIKFASGAYEGPYTYKSRFEEGTGTNPEEFLAAAHAGCFSMAFSNQLAKAGFTPEYVHTTAKVHLDKTDAGFKITKIDLETDAKVPGIDDAKFQEVGANAKKTCPVSVALSAVEITLSARLVS
jgi:osmotically inducible protein OsmC